MRNPQIIDRWGNPVSRGQLTERRSMYEGIRSPLTGYPADGLDPLTLAAILRAADAGEPVRYLELAEAMEERDAHYHGVIGTRKRAVAQIGISVEAASDAAADVEIADQIRDWLGRDELAEEIFHILDCLGKGVSFTRIDWDRSEGQWRPLRLERWDPRLFRFDRTDLTTPRTLLPDGRDAPLEPFRFVYAAIAAKSGLPLRSGLARIAAWAWMFKAYTLRDWTMFTQTYGQPLRLGRWQSGASEDDKRTLFDAVANIAGDCAAIVPEGMNIEFVETGNVGAASDLYERRCDWLDRQVSKAVLGQTTTTDAVSGGHAVSREHRLVQEDIETADARALAAILNRDLIRPWVDLEWGVQVRYPRLVIAREKAEDLLSTASLLEKLVPLGLRVSAAEVRDRAGFSDPEPSEPVLSPPVPPPAPGTAPLKGVGSEIKGGEAPDRGDAALQTEGAPAAKNPGVSHIDLLTDRMAGEAQPEVARMLGQIEAMVTAAGSLEELHAMLLAGFPQIDAAGLAARLATGLTAARLAGAVAAGEDADG